MSKRSLSRQQQYLGPNKILAVKETDQKTPLGSEIVEVIFEHGRSRVFPKLVLEKFSTRKPVDYTAFWQSREKELVAKLLEVIMEYDVNPLELTLLVKSFASKALDAWDRASHFLWTGHDESWAPGANFQDFLTLLDADRILNGINKGKKED